MFVENGAKLHPFLVVVQSPDLVCDANEILKDRDLGAQLRDGLRGGCAIHHVLHLGFELETFRIGCFQVHVFVVVDRQGRKLRVEPGGGLFLLRRAHRFLDAGEFAEPVFESALAAFQRPQDRFRAGGEAALQNGQGESDVVSAFPVARLGDAFGASHFRAHIVGDEIVEFPFGRAQFVGHRVGAAFREQRFAFEGEQVLLDHAAHEAFRVGTVHPLTVLALETVPVQQRHEQLEILFFSRVRGGGHQQEVVCGFREQPAQFETFRLGHLARPGRVVGGHAVCLVDHGDVPVHLGKLFHQVFVAGDLIHSRNQPVVVGEDVAAVGVVDHLAVENLETQVELGGQFFAPLLHQPAGSDDDRPFAIGTQDQFLDVEAGHDRLPGTRVVGQQEPQRETRKQFLVHGADLMRQRVHIRAVDRDHRVVQGGVFDAQRLRCEPELVRVAVERRSGFEITHRFEISRVGLGDHAAATGPGLVPVEDLHQGRIHDLDGDHGDRLPRNQAADSLPRTQNGQTGRGLCPGHRTPPSGSSRRRSCAGNPSSG